MAISDLRIKDFRNLKEVEIKPCETGINILYGDNGSGKTSLLEAIYYLGLGRSFRSSFINSIIHHSSSKFSLFAQLINNSQRKIHIGIERELTGSVRIRLDEKDTNAISELATLLPMRIINSFSFQLFEAGPALRRKYLDWGLFYHNDQFLPCWRAFERVLKQRNSLLREKKSKSELEVWTLQLVQYGDELNNLRKNYVLELIPYIQSMINELLDIQNFKMDYQSGWNEEKNYSDVLNQNYHEELRLGTTQLGPHRADLDITINGLDIKHFLSRGQQKLLICAMILAQGRLMTKHVNKQLIYLVDDLPSELDNHSRNKLISLLSRQPTQIFITAIEKQMIGNFINDFGVTNKVFHVKHGDITLE